MRQEISQLFADNFSNAVVDANSSQIKLIEDVCRAAHTLKGASRVVEYRDIEALCEEIERIFLALKKGVIELRSEDYEVLQRSGDMIAGLLDSTVEKSELVIAALLDELADIGA